MLQVVVRRGMDSNRLDVHFLARAHDAQRDFTATGNNDFVEHGLQAWSVGVTLVDHKQDLFIFDWFAVLCTKRFDCAVGFGLNLVHHFH